MCLLSTKPTAGPLGKFQIARSPGSSSLLLTPLFLDEWALLLTPSKQLKALPARLILAHRGAPMLSIQRSSRLVKAGFRYNLGFQPRVRGTVKNANDHPNGGRSRALRLSKTPWGLIAKRPRARA